MGGVGKMGTPFTKPGGHFSELAFFWFAFNLAYFHLSPPLVLLMLRIVSLVGAELHKYTFDESVTYSTRAPAALTPRLRLVLALNTLH